MDHDNSRESKPVNEERPQAFRSTKCRFFTERGGCKYGDNCRFSHVRMGGLPSTTSTMETAEKPPPSEISKVSIDNDSQPITVLPAINTKNIATTISQRRINQLCHNFIVSNCTWGDKCWYKHDEEARQRRLTLEAARAQMKKEHEASTKLQRIVLGSALVTFGAGLEIINLISGFDSCRVKISRLPAKIEDTDIMALFWQQGIDNASFYLIPTDRKQATRLEAEIITTAEIGKVIFWALNGLEFREEHLSCSIVENSSPDAMDLWNTANCKVLTVSWRTPSVTMIANYETEEGVQQAIRLKHKQTFLRKKIAVYKLTETSVKILGLPLDVDEKSVQDFMGAQSVEIELNLRATYSADYVETALRVHFDLWKPSNDDMKPIQILKRVDQEFIRFDVSFNSYEHAKAALGFLQEGRILLRSFPAPLLRLPSPFGYSVRIPIAQYNAQEKQWDELINGSKDVYVCNREHHVFINIRGEDKKVVGALKVKVEHLAKGERLEPKFWHRYFQSRMGENFLRGIFEQTGAYVFADWRFRVLKLFGDQAARKNALTLLTNEIERLAALECPVELHPRSIKFFTQTGLSTLKEELGEDSVSFHRSPSGKFIVTITGGEQAKHTLERLIKASLQSVHSSFQSVASPDSELCPICYTEIIHPIDLCCGHAYCTTCFQHYLGSISNNKSFPVLCMGNEDKCKAPIGLPIIQQFLTGPQFDRLLEVAADTYVDNNPNKFKYCPTPECNQVYSCQLEQTASQCPTCFAIVCTSCHDEGHEGLTCKENKLHKNPAEQERLNEVWARENGARNCPRCQVLIQKIEGCNHMQCRCGAHICWKCMGIFESTVIYEHLRNVHGGAFDVPPNITEQRRAVYPGNGPLDGRGRLDIIEEEARRRRMDAERVEQLRIGQEVEEARRRRLDAERARVQLANEEATRRRRLREAQRAEQLPKQEDSRLTGCVIS